MMRGLVLAAWVLTSACVTSEAVPCGELTCPGGSICDLENQRCIDPAAMMSCAGVEDGAACEVRGVPGDCRGGVCEPTICGDGRKAMSEACDGEDLGGATCLDAGFYEEAGLRCTQFCTFDTSMCKRTCGDGTIDRADDELCDTSLPAEACIDVGYDVGGLTCNGACVYDVAGCGRIGWRYETTLPSQPSSAPYFIHGSSANDVWVAGDDGQARHFDGAAWAPSSIGTTGDHASSVWTLSATDAWSTTSGGKVFHYNGTVWAQDTSAPAGARAVWALGASDVWVATASSGVKRWNGSTWSDVGGLGQANLWSIQGTSATDVWVASRDGIARHWNGTVWSAAQTIAPMATINAIAVVGPSDVHAVGYRTSNTNLWAIRAHYDGNTWTYVDGPFLAEYRSVSATGAADVWVGGNTEYAHFDGRTWITVPQFASQDMRIFAADAGNVFGVSQTRVHHHSGLVYGGGAVPGGFTYPASAMFTTPDGHIYIVEGSNPTIAHRDHDAWTQASIPAGGATAVWGLSGTDAWAVGTTGDAYRWNGTNWNTTSTIANPVALYALWGSSNTDVWAAGQSGAVRHYDGVSWSQRNITGFPASIPAVELAGTGPNDVWLRAASGELFHWTGSWTQVTTPAPAKTLVVMPAGGVIITNGTAAYHYNGTSWTMRPLPNVSDEPKQLVAFADDAVFGISSLHLFSWDGAQWTLITPPNMIGSGTAISGVANRLDLLYFSQRVEHLVITQPWR